MEKIETEMEDLIQDPSVPVENGQDIILDRIFEADHFNLYRANSSDGVSHITFEFDDGDGFTNAMSVPSTATQEDFVRIIEMFAYYVRED